MMSSVLPGDVVVVQLGGFGGLMIRLGAWLRHKPTHSNHVAIVTGDNEVVEAWPGGVRKNLLSNYLDMPYTLVNVNEPKTADQRKEIVALALSFLNSPYDWFAISEDVTNCLDINDPLVRAWTAKNPPHAFVCSSLASYIYSKVGLLCPYGGRFTTPADWAELILTMSW